MRSIFWTGCLLAVVLGSGCQAAETPAAPDEAAEAAADAYSPIPVDAVDEPGEPRQVRCQIGSQPEQTCTLTPLFGDDSFQLDGVGVALRMVVTGNEGGLFEVFGPEDRAAISGVYRRSSAEDPCWRADDEGSTPSPICVR